MSFVCPDKSCCKCPRLIEFRQANIAKYPHYYNGPVEPFGPLEAQILVVGLAPGLNGANQTNHLSHKNRFHYIMRGFCCIRC